MKKLYMLLACSGLLCASYAQNSDSTDQLVPRERFIKSKELGLHISPMVTWGKGSDESLENNGINLGVGYGVLLDLYFDDRYAISTGLNVVNRGNSVIYRDTLDMMKSFPERGAFAPGTEVSMRLQYVEIPVSLKLRTADVGKMRFHGLIGLKPAVNIKALANIKEPDGNKLEKELIAKEISPVDASFILGAGADYLLGASTRVSATLQMDNGLLDITHRDNQSVKNKGIMLKIGVLF